MKPLEVWQPRWSTGDCCILASKIRSDSQVYAIYFSKADSWKGNDLKGGRYVMRGHEIKKLGEKQKTAQGGKLVYAVPMETLMTFKENTNE